MGSPPGQRQTWGHPWTETDMGSPPGQRQTWGHPWTETDMGSPPVWAETDMGLSPPGERQTWGYPPLERDRHGVTLLLDIDGNEVPPPPPPSSPGLRLDRHGVAPRSQRSSHTNDLKTRTLWPALPGAYHHSVSPRTVSAHCEWVG